MLLVEGRGDPPIDAQTTQVFEPLCYAPYCSRGLRRAMHTSGSNIRMDRRGLGLREMNRRKKGYV